MAHLSRIILFLCCTLLPRITFSQDQFSPFNGSVHFGIGVSTLIDFKPENNSGYIPIQIGLKTHKYLNSDTYIDLGLVYSQRGYRHVIETSGPNWSMQEIYQIDLHYLDIPVIYYRKNSWITRVSSHHFFGITNSVSLVSPSVHTGYTVDIYKEAFRKYMLSSLAGLGLTFKQKLRLDLMFNISFLSVLKPSYRAHFEERVDFFGSRLIPVEIVMSVNYILNIP